MGKNKQTKTKTFLLTSKALKKIFFNPVDLMEKRKLPLKCLTKMVSFIKKIDIHSFIQQIFTKHLFCLSCFDVVLILW